MTKFSRRITVEQEIGKPPIFTDAETGDPIPFIKSFDWNVDAGNLYDMPVLSVYTMPKSMEFWAKIRGVSVDDAFKENAESGQPESAGAPTDV